MKRRIYQVVASIAALGIAAPVPAAAHAILMASTPAIGSTTTAGPAGISLRYNSLIDVKRSRVVLTDPDGRQTVLILTRSADGDGMTAHVVLLAGHNTLRWQVLAIDGHITRGDVPFDAGGTGAGGSPQGPVAER